MWGSLSGGDREQVWRGKERWNQALGRPGKVLGNGKFLKGGGTRIRIEETSGE